MEPDQHMDEAMIVMRDYVKHLSETVLQYTRLVHARQQRRY